MLSLAGSDKESRDLATLAAQFEDRILTGPVVRLNRRRRNRFHRMLETSARDKLIRIRRQLALGCQQPLAVSRRDWRSPQSLVFR
jgi:hypothetical protein